MASWSDLKNCIERSSQTVTLWWRDDDAHRADPNLNTLLSLSQAQGIPVALAVVPTWIQPSLAEALKGHSDRVSCLLHGYAHTNHATANERKCEYPESRSTDAVRAELGDGAAVMREALAELWQPVFVPPWNRIHPVHYHAMQSAGLVALSALFNNAPAPGVLNIPVHLDIIDWKARQFRGTGACLEVLIQAIERAGSQPIGVMTHHLDHDLDCWAFMQQLFEEVRSYRQCEFTSITHVIHGNLPDSTKPIDQA